VWIKLIEFQTQAAAAAAAVKVDVAASISHDLTFDVTSKITADDRTAVDGERDGSVTNGHYTTSDIYHTREIFFARALRR